MLSQYHDLIFEIAVIGLIVLALIIIAIGGAFLCDSRGCARHSKSENALSIEYAPKDGTYRLYHPSRHNTHIAFLVRENGQWCLRDCSGYYYAENELEQILRKLRELNENRETYG
jgi:hypothetical protein